MDDRRDRIPPPPKPGDRRNRPGDGQSPLKPGSNFTRMLFIWAIIFLGGVMIVSMLNGEGRGNQIEIKYPEFKEMVEREDIASITIEDNTRVTGRVRSPILREIRGQTRTFRHFSLELPEGIIDSELLEYWETKNVEYTFKSSRNHWSIYLWQAIPFILILAVWIFIMRQMQGGQRGVFSFGKSRARLLTGGKVQVTFNDVAGADEAKQELEEVIEFLKDPGRFQRLGGRIPKGVLLLGPPGTGKTLLARAVAGEAGVPFFSLSGSDFVEMFVGVGASRVRDLFEQGKQNAPCIIFIDELDAVGRHRGAGLGGGHDEREQTLNQLLVEMDGFESNDGVILISATNRPDVLDPALLRPGRFDRQVVVDLPDVKGREGIFRVHTRNIPLAKDIDLAILARTTPGLSGADLANLVNEGALLAARFNRDEVTMADMEEAKDKVMMGTERRSMVIADDEKKRIAYHESGHAIIGKLVPGSDPVHKVTIIPRGRALGLTHYLPIDERHLLARDYLLGVIKHLMAGRTAEKLIFGDVTTGAGNDIQRATEIARKMVQEWGMSEAVGPMHYGDDQEEIFLGRAIARQKDRSEETAQLIDTEVKKIIEECETEVHHLLKENLEGLKNLAETLLEYEILSGDEIDLAIAGKPLGREPGEPELPAADGVADESRPTDAAENAGGGESVSNPDPDLPPPPPAGDDMSSRGTPASAPGPEEQAGPESEGNPPEGS